LLLFFSSFSSLFFFSCSVDHRDLHSFPTRRSSDLFSAVQLTRLTKLMNFKLQMLVALPSLIISGIVGLTFAYLDYGVWSLVYMADRKSTRLNSSHVKISYAVFCLKKKIQN